MHKEGWVDDDLYNLGYFRLKVVRCYARYIVNGFRCHTEIQFDNRKTQNFGVMVRGGDSSNMEQYGVLKDIYKLHYTGGNRVFVFKCDQFDA